MHQNSHQFYGFGVVLLIVLVLRCYGFRRSDDGCNED